MQTKNNKHTNPPEWRQPRGLETCSVTPDFWEKSEPNVEGGTNPDFSGGGCDEVYSVKCEANFSGGNLNNIAHRIL
jgi:hypothetical protein